MSNELAAIAATCLAALAVRAEVSSDWENPSINSINRLPPRTYSMPLASETAALTDALEPETPYRKSLNGTWKLSWAGRPQDRVLGFEEPDFDDSDWFTIAVPGCVELSGFGAPGYVNWMYPHAVAWPRILDRDTKSPDYNPVSSYRTTFTVPETWKGRRIILRFDGVYSAYYVWVNGHKVGYAEDSKLPSEFDITPYLKQTTNYHLPSTNSLAVEVYRWCDGSYFEDQDMTRFSGIFRDVTLWAMPKDGIWDFAVKTTPVDGYDRWNLEVKVEGEGEQRTEVSLYDADMKKVCDLHSSPSPLTFASTLAARAWSAENPYLYTLVIKSGNPTIEQSNNSSDIRMKRIGFKEQKVVGSIFLVNGKAIKLKGVNRHETSPVGGRTVTLAEMTRDIELMKRFNINCVRTAHYPDHHLWYDLCDRYGIYVVAEANVESHELYQYGKTLAADPTSEHTVIERNVRHVGFYRNHPSVTIWSMGNETGHGDAFRRAIEEVRKLDSSRPVHWECGNRDADIDSRMYPAVEWVEKRGQYGDGTLDNQPLRHKDDKGDHTKGKVAFLCEYAHAMGNAVGNLQEYWDAIYRHDSLMGGCIWDWIDQALWKRPLAVSDAPYLSYGGDNDEYPNDGPFNCNGLIGATREVTPKLIEVGHVYRNLVVSRREDGAYELWNRFGFTDADEFECRWTLVEDGVETDKGKVDVPKVAPLSRGRFELPKVAPRPTAEAFLNLEFAPRKRPFWADGKWVAAREQIAFGKCGNMGVWKWGNGGIGECGKAKILEDEKTVTAICGGTTAVFCRVTGTLSRLTVGGFDVLAQAKDPVVACGPRLTYMRALVDNDKWLSPSYVFDGYDKATNGLWACGLSQPNYHARPIAVGEDGSVKVTVEVTGRKSAAFTHEATWRFAADGSVSVENRVTPHGVLPKSLPRLGLSLVLPTGLDRVRYYGRGPGENYIDRKTGSFIGIYRTNVNDMFVDYVRSQDNGYRSDVRWIEFTRGGKSGGGVRFSASEPLYVQALRHTWEDLSSARHEKGQVRRHGRLTPRDEIYVNLDVRQLGLGGASCGPGPMSRYSFDPKAPVSWTLRIEPVPESVPSGTDSRSVKLDWFLENEYGVRPPSAEDPWVEFIPVCPDRVMADGTVRKKVRATAHGPCGDFSFEFLAYIPKSASPVPAALLLCNRSGVMPTDAEQENAEMGFWPRAEILRRGYATAAFYLSDVAKETYCAETALQSGVFRAYERYGERTLRSWGVLSAWAWGASRVMDWMQYEPLIDARRVMVVGHSRGGKCALVTGNTDTRFAMVCANDSGTGGARLNRMELPKSEPWTSFAHFGVGYWFCQNYLQSIAPDNARSVVRDQDEWLSLIAPRLLAVGSAAADDWAGPEGERAAAVKAAAAWRRMGIPDGVQYGIRDGKHDLTPADWKRYLDFADSHWRRPLHL